MPDLDLNRRLTAVESKIQEMFDGVYLGDWGSQDGLKVPYYVAIRINPATRSLLINALYSTAQAKLTGDSIQSEALIRLTDEVIDDWCGTPPRPHPYPHWSDILSELGRINESFGQKSILREAAFDLSSRILDRVRTLNRSDGICDQ
ncbi:MAG: hypothetical protein ABI167_13320 [Nitrosospira sp.]